MYVWDEAKRRRNIAKHGVDFARMADFDWDSAIFRGSGYIDFEERVFGIGMISGVLHAVVYTERGELLRIISLRKASSQEIKDWHN